MGPSCVTVLSGGEALTPDLAARLLACTKAVWNAYGPTETTVWSTLWRVRGGEAPVPIGLPIAATTLRLVDEQGRDVGPGEVGELLIGGAGLARGYHGRSDLTRERFVLRDGERLYRTGDLARLRPDGVLECLGRTDHQVKVRGFRIELGDVEAALAACEGVGPCAVAAATTAAGERALVAYVCAAPGAAQPDAAGLRRALAGRLPDYMIPARFVVLAALPLTPSGKIDRNALPAAPVDGGGARDDAPDAQGDTEVRLAEIWRSILALATVSRDDNFFDLGGYSLLTVTLVNRIEAAFGRRLTMASLFAARTLADMALMLDAPEAAAPADAIPLQPHGARPPLVWLDAGPQLRQLAARLAPDQPLIGLTLDPAEEGFGEGALDVRDLAQRMTAKLRRFQPEGPYYLAGWCRWGTVAHAVAGQLTEEGEEVALLVLLDTVNHASAHQVFVRMKEAALKPLRRAEARPEFGARVEAAAVRYRPQPYLGEVLLMRAADAERDWDGGSGWSDAVRGGLAVIDLPGDHRSVLAPPFVDALAARLLTALVRAQA